MLKGKTIIIGVTGSIAAYKSATLASLLVKQGADVNVIMTKNATNFITPITFESLTGNKCLTDTFDRNFEFQVEHIALAKRADLAIIAPASANIIGKIASGIADDMLSTTLMACTCPVLISPAMNTRMFCNPIVTDNIKNLKSYGYEIIEPSSGYLACGDVGAGKMPEPSYLLERILVRIEKAKDMAGKTVLITAGPTEEPIDPVRYLTNHSTGKMGYALARQAKKRGADVILVSGRTNLDAPYGVKLIRVQSAADMYEAVHKHAKEADIICKAAAVADYTPRETKEDKIKKSGDETSLSLVRTKDILSSLGEAKRGNQILCGFSMETEHMLEHSKAKLQKKNLDMIVANNLKVPGAGFGTETNVVTLITKDEVKELPLMSKDDVADAIFDEILSAFKS